MSGADHRAWKNPRESTHQFLHNFESTHFPAFPHRFLHQTLPFCLLLVEILVFDTNIFGSLVVQKAREIAFSDSGGQSRRER